MSAGDRAVPAGPPRWWRSLLVRTVALVVTVVLLLGAIVVAWITAKDREEARAVARSLESASDSEMRVLAAELVQHHLEIARALVEGAGARTRAWIEEEPIERFRDKTHPDRIDVDALRRALVSEVRARSRLEREHLRLVTDRLDAEATARVDRAAATLRREADALGEAESAARTSILAGRLAWLLAGIAVLLALALRWAVLSPVSRLRRVVSRIAGGDLSTPVGAAARRGDELGALARDVDGMRDALARAQAGLTAEVRAKTADLAATLAERTHALAELEATKDRLVQAAKMASLGTLAGGLAHEFNNLLGGIRSCVDAARAETRDPTVREDLDVAFRTADRGLALVRGMLDVARPGARGLQPVDLAALVDDGVRTACAGAGGRSVRREARPVPPVRGDAAQLHQVALNLVANALQATEEDEPVVVATRAEGAYGVLEVRDGGPGVDPAVQDRIFEPFFTSRAGGTGLGLFVSYGIVERHGGRIEVGEAPEGGAAFTVRIPLARPGADGPPTPPDGTMPADASR